MSLPDKLKSDLIFAVALNKRDAIDETIAELIAESLNPPVFDRSQFASLHETDKSFVSSFIKRYGFK